ncbi:MAG: hypothetical protein WCP17_03720 [bacterium]
MPTEGVPQGLHRTSDEVEKRRFRAQVSLLEGAGEIEVKGAELRPTVFDLQGLDMQDLEPNSLEEEEYFLKWIRRVLEVSPELINDEKSTRESNEFYTKLNYAFFRAKDFLRQTLNYPEKQSTKVKINRFDSKEEIFSLLRKTKLPGEKIGLDQSIIYCRLVKATIAEYRLLVAGVLDLEKVKNEVEEAITTSPFPSVKEEAGPLVKEGEEGYMGQKFCLSSNSEIEGTMEARIKTTEKAMLRFITRPEANEHAAMEDATAFRLTVSEPIHAFLVLKEINQFFKKNNKVVNLRLENKNILSPASIKEAQKIGIHIETAKNKGFQGLIIKGGFGSKEPNKQFEIQIVLEDNKNEEGGMHHDIYDIKKKVIACTRLSGGCSAQQLLEFAEEALTNSALDEKEIRKELLEGKNAPIVRIKRRGGPEIYVAREVYQRWDGFNWIDRELADAVLG